MDQIVQSGQFVVGRRADVALGGMYAWKLPVDRSCASVGRSLLGRAIASLPLKGDKAEDAVLVVSELVTNALNHGLRVGGQAPIVPPELWVWTRVTPAPQLVVSVFDACRAFWPGSGHGDLLDEHGKGLGIVEAVADAWGTHCSRSWLSSAALGGKVVWSAFALTSPSPNSQVSVPPVLVARYLASTLKARGVRDVSSRHGGSVSLVSVKMPAGGQTNIWVERGHIGFAEGLGKLRVRRPVADLHDVAEQITCRVEEANVPGADWPRNGRRSK